MKKKYTLLFMVYLPLLYFIQTPFQMVAQNLEIETLTRTTEIQVEHFLTKKQKKENADSMIAYVKEVRTYLEEVCGPKIHKLEEDGLHHCALEVSEVINYLRTNDCVHLLNMYQKFGKVVLKPRTMSASTKDYVIFQWGVAGVHKIIEAADEWKTSPLVTNKVNSSIHQSIILPTTTWVVGANITTNFSLFSDYTDANYELDGSDGERFVLSGTSTIFGMTSIAELGISCGFPSRSIQVRYVNGTPAAAELVTLMVGSHEDGHSSGCSHSTNTSSRMYMTVGVGSVIQTTEAFVVSNTNTSMAIDGCVALVVAPLPITYSSFLVSKSKNKNYITWQTASETNNDYFQVERSADGRVFENIRTVKGQGNSYQKNQYSFIDESPFSTTYYRLVSVDFDKTTHFSKIIVVNRDKTDDWIQISSNVSEALNIQIFDDSETIIQLEIFEIGRAHV